MAVGGVVWFVVKWPFRRPQKTDLSDDTINRISPAKAKDGSTLTIAEFIRIRRELKADLEAELAQATLAEQQQLHARIAELESQIADPESALAKALQRIAALEALLERSGNDIGADRLTEARTALERGDYSIADDIFAEIEARREMEVQEAARAAFGRGEIAEAEVRWADAAAHYARAARLHPEFENLFKAVEFAQLSGNYDSALRLSDELVSVAREMENKNDLARALDRKATALWRMGHFEKADSDFRQALTLAEQATGVESSEYEQILNNLGINLKAQKRYPEAEEMLRRALNICGRMAGEDSIDYGIRLSNLALVLKEQRQYPEAEKLMLEAIDVHKKSLGDKHPTYATDLANLAGVYDAQRRFPQSAEIYQTVLEIDRQTIGEFHPHYGISLCKLARALCELGRWDEAEEHFLRGLEILRDTVGVAHPAYLGAEKDFSALKSIRGLPGK